jgi:N-acetyltransferase
VSFELQPTLTSELLELRPLREEDYPELYTAASDPLIWEIHPQPDRYKDEIFRRDYFEGAIASGGAFAIIDRKTGVIVGSSRYHDHRPEQSEIEIGWTFLARSHWGGEYNRELKRLMLGHALQYVDRALFFVGTENLRSRRAMEKIGGTLIGERADVGERRNVIFEITSDSFANGPLMT